RPWPSCRAARPWAPATSRLSPTRHFPARPLPTSAAFRASRTARSTSAPIKRNDPRFPGAGFAPSALTPFLGRDIMQLTRAQTGRRRRNDASRRHLARPRFERLEGRTMLSTWMVTDNSDDPTDTGSLRYAINNAPDGTTINFEPKDDFEVIK